MRHGQSNDGLTLVELLVTVALAALLVTLAAPSFQGLITKMQRSTVISGISEALFYARGEAVRRGAFVSICALSSVSECATSAAPDWNLGWLIFSDGDGDGVLEAGDELLRVAVSEHRQYSLKGAGAIAQSLTFKPDGAPMAFGSLAYCDPYDSKTLEITFVGRVKYSSGSGACP
jgi:type IV fimbrial biogenesis protein FimT